MPTVNLYGPAAGDGWVLKSGSNWTDVRDATTGSLSSNTASNNAYGIRATVTSGRGGTNYILTRSFFNWDTSGVTLYPSSGTFKVYGRTFTSGTPISCIKSTAGSIISTADFDAIPGWQTGGVNNSSNVTSYANNLNSWSTSSYNDFTLNATALNDIRNNDTFKICLLTFNEDLRNGTPSTTNNMCGVYYIDSGSALNMPYLNLTTPDAPANNAIFMGTNF